jgi:hypothetical protein
MSIVGVSIKRNGAYEDQVSAAPFIKVSGQYLVWDQPTVLIKADGVYGAGGGELPTNLTPPVIAGNAAVGETLTCTPGTWDGVPTPVINYQWYADSLIILGENNLTHVVTAQDAGHVVTCHERATNTLGTVSEPSNGIAIPALTGFSSGFGPGFGA